MSITGSDLNPRVRIGLLIVVALGLLTYCGSRTRLRIRYRVIPVQPSPQVPAPARDSRLI